MKISTDTLYFLLAHIVLFFIFFFINFFLMKYKRSCWNGILEDDCETIIDSFYYTTATHTSIGFGDITPKNKKIKIITSLHMIMSFFLIILNIDVIKN